MKEHLKGIKLILTTILILRVFTTLYAQEYAVPPLIECDLAGDFNGYSIIKEKLSDRQGRLLQPTSEIRVTYIGFPVEARAAFQRAVNIWERYLSSSVPILIEATWANNLPSQTLASSRATRIVNNFSNAPFRNVWYVIPLAESLAGRDLNNGSADIKIDFNSDVNWHTGEESLPHSLQYDLTTIALHEICHGLGFTSSMKVEGEEGTWGQSGLAYIYDLFLQTQNSEKLVNPTRIGNPSKALKTLLTSNDLGFEITDIFYDQYPPKLSSNDPFRNGVSTSHLDEDFYPSGNPFSLMTPQAGLAEVIHDPGNVSLYILQEMGWVIPNLNQLGPLVVEKPRLNPKLFPNPCQDDVCQVLIPQSQINAWDIYTLFNSHGQQISTASIDKVDATVINLQGLNPGMYLVRLSGSASPSWLKLVKL